MPTRIAGVEEGSLAATYGIQEGMEIISLNGKKRFDVLDYLEACAGSDISLELAGLGEVVMQNDFEVPIGLTFEEATIAKVKKCQNKCTFCFLDQMPKGLRDSLYVRDDDYRLSFLSGNYITLTNMTDSEFNRIIKLHISPLYISVHSTNPAVRESLLGNKKAGAILSQLERLARGGISMNLQFVLVPGVNDGDALASSFQDLMGILSSVDSVACVPVGLTAYRDGLCPLRPFAKEEAESVIDVVERFRQIAIEQEDSAIFAAADEFYLLAGRPLPDDEYYEGYPQYEDGVGIARSFLEEIDDSLFGTKIDFGGYAAAVLTGVLAEPILNAAAQMIESATKGLRLAVYGVENRFFGGHVSVAGLLCAEDLLGALEGVSETDVFVPSAMLNDEGLFLDGLSLSEFRKRSGKNVYVSDYGGVNFLHDLKQASRKKR